MLPPAASLLQVQQRSVPVLLAGRDALVRSPTGSGKTLAYLAPLLHSLQVRLPLAVVCLLLCASVGGCCGCGCTHMHKRRT
jgi:superfamily II DNA/RNA helicase